MINSTDDYILFIEPKGEKSSSPINDALTEFMEDLMKTATVKDSYKGVHTCSCGKKSTSETYQLKSGHITNSLANHYLAYHRAEVPRSELAKLLIIAQDYGC